MRAGSFVRVLPVLLKQHNQRPGWRADMDHRFDSLSADERCPTCGQPDNCGDCDHTPLTDEEVRLLLKHTATLRKGIVGPGEPGQRVFESNFVMECSCGYKSGYATTSEATARRWMAEHLQRHERLS